MVKHTQAPWGVFPEISNYDNFTHSVYEDGYKGTLICRGNQNNAHLDDMKLIAAAPEMYEALKIVATAEVFSPDGLIDFDVLEIMQDEARKVIAKAEGKIK